VKDKAEKEKAEKEKVEREKAEREKEKAEKEKAKEKEKADKHDKKVRNSSKNVEKKVHIAAEEQRLSKHKRASSVCAPVVIDDKSDGTPKLNLNMVNRLSNLADIFHSPRENSTKPAPFNSPHAESHDLTAKEKIEAESPRKASQITPRKGGSIKLKVDLEDGKVKKSQTTDALSTLEATPKLPSPTKLETPGTPEVKKDKRDEKKAKGHRREHSDVTGMSTKNTDGDLLIKLQKDKIEKEKKI